MMSLKSWIQIVVVVGLMLSLGLAAPRLDPPAQAAPQQTIRYVTEGAGDTDCDSWANACGLQFALDDSEDGDEIWVAAGTYTPTSTDRTVSFQLRPGVALYGGFPAAGGTWDDRDWETHETILSGDLSGNDGPDFANNGENSYHVVTGGSTVTETAVLDGFTISGGNADLSPPPTEWGGGMYLLGSSPTLRHVLFVDNVAKGGGGMFSNGGAPSLVDVVFAQNKGLVNGGGLHTYGGSSPSLTNVTFIGNSATGASPDGNGGGMCTYPGSNPTLTNVTFSGNSATRHGGGMYSLSSAPELIAVTFTSNHAEAGAGMFSNGGGAVLVNVEFSQNIASINGGGLHTHENSWPTLTNCTFSGNSAATGAGGGIYNLKSTLHLTNTILWGNEAATLPQMANADSGGSEITYSDIQSGCAAIAGNVCGLGNIGDLPEHDPLFVDAAGGDLRLRLTSPAIDAGDNDAPDLAAVATDLGGHPRLVDVPTVDDTGNGTAPIVDMGAYETPPPRIYVDMEATGANDGTSWQDAFTDLQDALTWALDGVEIWVAEGTYTPGSVREATFRLVPGVAAYGGFDPSVGDVAWGDRDWVNNLTVLSGDLEGNDGPDFANNDENSYHVVSSQGLTETAVLDGFTITAGNADGGIPSQWHGGGMYNDGSSPTVANCTFTANAAASGGGMSNRNGSAPTLTGCTFEGNQAQGGGGMLNESSSPTLTDCTFSNNAGPSSGGGVYNSGASSPVLTNCTFSNNRTSQAGGGLSNGGGSPTLSGCAFDGNLASTGGALYNAAGGTLAMDASTVGPGNTAGYAGGGIANGGVMTVTHSTITGNLGTATEGGAGIFNTNQGQLSLTNSTISGNATNVMGGGIFVVGGSVDLDFCTVAANTADLNGDDYGGGGGIYLMWGSVQVKNSIIAGNGLGVGSEAQGPDVIGTFSSLGYNLVGNAEGAAGFTADGDQTGSGDVPIDPLLEALALNPPGSTATHALLSGSPALDWIPAGVNDCGMDVTADQRGVARPQGDGCDVGAYELGQVYLYLPLVMRP